MKKGDKVFRYREDEGSPVAARYRGRWMGLLASFVLINESAGRNGRRAYCRFSLFDRK